MPISKNVEDTIISIARCDNIDWGAGIGKGDCEKIVAHQGISPSDFKKEHQLPEAFSGKIDEAKYLLISSNPFFDPSETPFPKFAWKDEEIVSYFYNRMGNYPNKRYLNACKNIISWIYPKETIETKDIAMTEIVHCKSQGEEGVDRLTCKACGDAYFTRVLNLFTGKCIVLCGCKLWNHIKSSEAAYNALLDQESKGVKIVMSYHPTYHYGKDPEAAKKKRVDDSLKVNDWKKACKPKTSRKKRSL